MQNVPTQNQEREEKKKTISVKKAQDLAMHEKPREPRTGVSDQ